MRRHGWQRPLHPLQMVGMSIYCFLVASFYCFLGLFLGSRIADITLSSIFTFLALSVMFLFIRCCAIDPTDHTRFKNRKNKKKKNNSNNHTTTSLNYGSLLSHIFMTFFRRMERKFLRNCVRNKYLDPWKTSAHMEPLLPFPLVIKDDSISPDPLQDDISFCSLCDFEVKKHSKHCRTCNRCVEGFDHHCRWLNNCIGRKNYRTFILLMIFVLLMLVVEGGTAVAIFIRCFADKRGIEQELERKLFVEFPRGVLAGISVLLVLLTAYGSAALGQLFFFHVVLIRKGMQTYDYIMAMKEENRSMELELSEDSDFSSEESIEFDSPEKPQFISRFMCRGSRIEQNPQMLSVRVDAEPKPSTFTKKEGFRASINPWTLIKMSSDKALMAAEKARERLVREKAMAENDSLKPLPLETKSGPSMKLDKNMMSAGSSGLTPLIIKGGSLSLSGSPGRFSSPRRRFSSSPSIAGAKASPKHMYKSNFDLKLTEVSRELETYISKQVLCSVMKKDGSEVSPR